MENEEIDDEPRNEESEELGEDMEAYLLERFGGKRPDSEIEDYLKDKFTQHPLPHGATRKKTVQEMLFEIRQRRI